MLCCIYTVLAGNIVVMYVAKVPNRGSPPAVLLRESYREAGKVKNRTLANLSAWPEAKVDALSRVLKGQLAPAAAAEGTFEIARSLPHGHVAAVLEAAAPGPRRLDLLEPGRRPLAVAGPAGPHRRRAAAETAASSAGPWRCPGCDEGDLYALDWLAGPGRRLQPGRGGRDPGPTTCPPPRSRGACPSAVHSRRSARGPQIVSGLHLQRRRPGRHRGVRGQHRRPEDRRQPGEQAQGPDAPARARTRPPPR